MIIKNTVVFSNSNIYAIKKNQSPKIIFFFIYIYLYYNTIQYCRTINLILQNNKPKYLVIQFFNYNKPKCLLIYFFNYDKMET